MMRPLNTSAEIRSHPFWLCLAPVYVPLQDHALVLVGQVPDEWRELVDLFPLEPEARKLAAFRLWACGVETR